MNYLTIMDSFLNLFDRKKKHGGLYGTCLSGGSTFISLYCCLRTDAAFNVLICGVRRCKSS